MKNSVQTYPIEKIGSSVPNEKANPYNEVDVFEHI